MKRWLPALCIALLTTLFPGASAWEGSAMMSAYGEFPDSGYYAACNSFPRNTAVEVVNLENGKTVTVIVTKGLDNPGIFLLLSPEAAKVISMEPGTVSRVRVSAPRNIIDASSSGSGSAGDPDFNPSLLASRSGAYKSPEAPKESPPAESTPKPRAEEPKALPEEIVKPPAPVPDFASEPKEPGKLNTKEAPLVRPEVLARSAGVPEPSGPVSAPILEPDISAPTAKTEEKAVVHGLNPPQAVELPVQAALADPVLVPDESQEAALTQEARPADPKPGVALTDLEIRMDEPGKPETPAQVPEGPAGAEVIVSLEPTAPKPPETTPKPSTPDEPAAVVKTVVPAEKAPPAPASTAFVKGKYYIQIGAFRTSAALDTAAARLAGSFPVTVDTISSGSSPVYRLFVGPLGRDETGVALLQVRSLGFKEAFLKN